MKKLSVTRLELLSCLLLSKLLSKLVKSVIAAFTSELSAYDVIARTDSEISYRITQVQKEWNTWVENRVNHEVRDIVPPHSWRHIPGTSNPADLATREINPEEITGQQLVVAWPRLFTHVRWAMVRYPPPPYLRD